MGKLEGKVALVTGGTSGIGLATAERFALEGAYVFVTGRRQAELDKAVKRIGSSNVKGIPFTVQKALPLLVDGASVILNASTTASTGSHAFSVYSATKAAVRSFARTWTLDLKERRIRVNAVSPGGTDTPGLDGLAQSEADKLAVKNAILASIPMGRLASPDEIAKAVVFLASDDSSYVTGIELFVDGGMAQV